MCIFHKWNNWSKPIAGYDSGKVQVRFCKKFSHRIAGYDNQITEKQIKEATET